MSMTDALAPAEPPVKEPRPGPDNVPVSMREEEDKVQMVRDLFYRARDARRPMVNRWKRNYKVLNNRTWSPGGESWEPHAEISQMWPVVASMVAWMTDQRPTLQTMASGQAFSPHHDFYDGIAKDLNAILESNFVTYDESSEITRLLWDVATYSVGWTRTIWQPTLADGLGDTTFRRIDPFTVYPDPHARSPKDMSHIIEARMMTLSDLDRAWPGSAKRLGYEGFLEDIDEAPHKLSDSSSSTAPRAAIAPPSAGGSYSFQKAGRGTSHGGSLRGQEDPVVTVLECWVRSHKATKTDDPNVYRVEDDWKVYVTCGNRLIYEGKAEDVSGFNTHPYDRCVLFDTGEMYGPCLVEFMTSPQESINRIVANIERNMMLMGNPMLVRSPRAQGRHRRTSNRPGAIIEAEPSQIDWKQPPQMHPQIASSLLQYFESKIESISGMSAIVRGFQPSGRNAQGVLDSVQDAAFVRIRATLRELERTLKGITSKKAANIAEFYTEPRMVAIIGDDGQRVRRALAAKHFYSRDGDQLPLKFTIMADAGSQLPTSKQARSAEADTLFGMGAIDTLELLKAKQWPNYAVVAKRVMEQQAAGMVQGAGQRQTSRA